MKLKTTVGEVIRNTVDKGETLVEREEREQI